MAQRRMFSLKVVDTDSFLEMSASAQNLYFHLGMRADDDGFVSSPKKIMMMCNASDDDMKILIAKNFIIKMATNGVSVVTHWHVNNLIRPDRYQETEYKEEKSRLEIKDRKYIQNLGIPFGIPNDNQMTTQYRVGKGSIDKNAEQALPLPFSLKEELEKIKKDSKRHIQLIGEYLEEKKVPIASKKELQVAIKRHVRDAIELSSFTDERIGWATSVAEKEYPAYTLKTLVKILTR